MRIAIVIWQLDMYGGSIRQALELAINLQKTGHKVDFFTYSVNKEKCFPELLRQVRIFTPPPIKWKQVIYDPNISLPQRIGYFIYNLFVQEKQAGSLANLIREKNDAKKYDVINLHDNGLLSIPLTVSDTRFVWMMNDPPSFIDTLEKQASVFSNSPLLKFLVTLQAIESRWRLRRVENITVLDHRNANIVSKYFHRDAQIVRSGLDVPKSLITAVKKSKKIKTILTTNIFFRHRRYEDLVVAANILINKRKILNLQFRIVGASDADEGYYSEILALVKKYKLEKYFVFLGRVDEKTLKDEYAKADIFVFPNHNQTWGLSVFEAMLNRCAVVVSSGSGAHEVLSNGENAMVYPSKNARALAKSLESLALDRKVMNRVAKSGQDFVLANISWLKYAEQMLAVFTR